MDTDTATATAPLTSNGNVPSSDPNIVVAQEFQYLLEKSQQLFAGLRDLPPTGKNWQTYFQRTFEVYTRLWKYQQTHRQILENKDYHGLKRWDIGEVASKIGQLYYHYYLRTSETNYLLESHTFYDAIRKRQYFKDVLEVNNPALVIKKLRYYARFIVVCLFLNETVEIRELMEELTALIADYTKIFNPSDSAEWNVVLSEISTFLEAQKKTTPVDLEGKALLAPTRLQIERTPKFDKDGAARLRLQEAILVGNYQNQIKFSELTLDMYRLLQALEREPTTNTSAGKPAHPSDDPNAMVRKEEDAPADGSGLGSSTSAGDKSNLRRSNPHKYLLYRPTFAQLLYYIATTFKDINENSAMLIYISADGAKRPVKSEHMDPAYLTNYSGGAATAVNQNYARKGGDKTDSEQHTPLVHCLHPNDLVPFSRKPLFVIVDSTNSAAFKDFPKIFPQSVAFLMSPTEYPASIKDNAQIGSLFTLFLTTPIKAFAFISDITEVSKEVWEKCSGLVKETEILVGDLLDLSTELDAAYKRFLQDDFLRQFLIRFVITDAILHLHSSFKDPQHFPSAFPAMAPSIAATPELHNRLKELVDAAGVGGLYNFPTEAKAEPVQ
ncbi:protein SCAI [Fimicolochytrium jonesii]|uniref:protein SCAI n=1 Tax=Fimicolochytrium jonesii TaxID=1396493 RepID=UPI0022FEDB3E|nr:protein SCAI [Fimicolochytrium jonesii]KAI8824112.1 protein SCAI [Fimicolochytrium jonesii]